MAHQGLKPPKKKYTDSVAIGTNKGLKQEASVTLEINNETLKIPKKNHTDSVAIGTDKGVTPAPQRLISDPRNLQWRTKD